MLSTRFHRLTIAVLAAAALAVPAQLAAQTPDHPTDNTAQFPSKNDLKSLTTAGSYLAARHASVERDATSAAAFYRSALRTDPKNSELLDRAFISSLADGDIEEAVKLADRILTQDKANRVARLVVGVRDLKLKKYAAAQSNINQSVRGPITDLVATLLAYDDTRGVPMASMPHTGFQRLDAGNTALIIDTGPPPPASVSQDAHAGCLSFELSSGVSRIVVNCGMPSTGRDNWRPFARSTAAHSTLTYRDTSSCQFVELSAMKRLLRGAPITSGPSNVESYREAVPDGDVLTASHDGYLSRFGVIHRRVLMVAQDGTRLEGEDSLSPAPGGRIKGSEADFALRFHLHPSVKASRLSDARGVMLVLPNRDVWTFEAMDDKVDLEDSVFLAGNDGPRRTSQIVIRQDARQAGTIRWSFVRSSTSASATTARRNARREPELPL